MWAVLSDGWGGNGFPLLSLFISSVTEFVPALLIAARKSLCKNIAPFQIDTVWDTEKTRENGDIFQICIFKSHVFTLDKVERYVYGHVIHTWVLPSSLMGLRSGLHPSMLTNTQPLPQIFWRFPLVTQLPNQLQKPLVKHREQFPRGWACCLCNSYLPPPGGTLYC